MAWNVNSDGLDCRIRLEMCVHGQAKRWIDVGLWSDPHMVRYAGRAEVPLARVLPCTPEQRNTCRRGIATASAIARGRAGRT